MTAPKNLEKIGYELVREAFSPTEIQTMRELILEYRTPATYLQRLAQRMLVSYVGDEVIDFMTCQSGPWPKLSHMLCSRLLPMVHEKFGEEVEFGFHNDIGINMANAWHKDILGNGVRIGLVYNISLAKFETHDLWQKAGEEEYSIYKCCIYLNTPRRNDGLRIVPGSHHNRQITADSIEKHDVIRPRPGDILLFDQRVTHKGVGSERFSMEDRVLISIGFGKRNLFTHNFAQGTRCRQDIQNRWIARTKAVPWNAGFVSLLVAAGACGSWATMVYAAGALASVVLTIEGLLLAIKTVVYNSSVSASY